MADPFTWEPAIGRRRLNRNRIVLLLKLLFAAGGVASIWALRDSPAWALVIFAIGVWTFTRRAVKAYLRAERNDRGET